MSAHLIAEKQALAVLAACRGRGLKLVTVESCTGGLVIAALTDIAGSSDVVECGLITYSNAAKTALAGVPASLITQYGAVSKQVALAMAEGGIKHSDADIAVAVTGIAGPDGGSDNKPVGLVHMAVASSSAPSRHYEARFGAVGRSIIREKTVQQALALILDYLA